MRNIKLVFFEFFFLLIIQKYEIEATYDALVVVCILRIVSFKAIAVL